MHPTIAALELNLCSHFFVNLPVNLMLTLYAASAMPHDRYAAAFPQAQKAALPDIPHIAYEWMDSHGNNEALPADPDNTVFLPVLLPAPHHHESADRRHRCSLPDMP